MTTFARYYNESKQLIEVSMDQVAELIDDSGNRQEIAELIYKRYYERYLKIFFFQSGTRETYYDLSAVESEKDHFNAEYKNGFAIMVNCCLLIETLASFLEGRDSTPIREGEASFLRVFNKSKEYDNELNVFIGEDLYRNVRNKLLHQGEIYGSFKIRRTGDLFDKSTKIINATKFCIELNEFLKSYAEELADNKTDWDGVLWINCKKKLGYIIKNAENP